jgi:hypothetical protein
MRIERQNDGLVRVYLSRRNLKALLAKLDGNPPLSFCTLLSSDETFAVTAEENEEHYAHPSRGDAVNVAGAMHPETEEVLGLS